MSKDHRIFLEHIFESIQIIKNYTSKINKDEFINSLQIQDAVIRRLEIIGEAVKQLPLSLKEQYFDIPWRKIAGMRDMLIH